MHAMHLTHGAMYGFLPVAARVSEIVVDMLGILGGLDQADGIALILYDSVHICNSLSIATCAWIDGICRILWGSPLGCLAIPSAYA